MTTAFWITMGAVLLCSMLTLRGTIGLVARGADNGWDNALAYVAFTALAFAFPFRWMVLAESWLLLALALPMLWAVQTGALRLIYEISTLRAFAVGALHTVFATTLISTLSFCAGVIAAYLLYSKIVTDPLLILRMVLRLIGIELPAI